MSKIKKLQLVHFRNITQATLNFTDGLNLIVGDNAAGKTSIIEAIWALSTGKSFRSAKPTHLINNQHPQFTLFAEISQAQQTYKIGFTRSATSTTCKINGENAPSQASMATHLPVQLLTPESHRILEEGPKIRRQFIDWGCFYYKKDFINLWRTYHRALKQRNQALKQRLAKEQVQIWDHQLLEAANKIDLIRSEYIKKISPFVKKFCNALMPEITEDLSLNYYAGWSKTTQNYQQILQQNYYKDAKLGHTQYGCHRADIKFKFASTDVMLKLSRGQQKLFVCALLLAQASVYELTYAEQVIMLIDDLPAELDENHRLTLLKLLNSLNIQHIVTTTSTSLIPNLADNITTIHIEHGEIS